MRKKTSESSRNIEPDDESWGGTGDMILRLAGEYPGLVARQHQPV